MNRLSQIAKRFKTMSPIQILKRLATIFKRYGLGKSRFSRSLNGFIDLALKYHIKPSFPVTASVMARHPVFFRNAVDRGVELAVHGFRHIDYSHAEDPVFEKHYQLALSVFRESGLTNFGHRFPYLRRNSKRLASLGGLGLKWDSSETILWPVLNQNKLEPFRREALNRILESYEVKTSDEYFSLPSHLNGMIEIPVSLPDDDILIERLGITESEELFDLWWNLIEQAKSKSELAVLQLHPERFAVFAKPLELILQHLKMDKSAWIAPLGEIAEWWKNGRIWEWKIESIEPGIFQIDVTCSNDAEIQIQGGEPITLKSFKLKSTIKPTLGIEPNADPGWSEFAKQEGFAYERSTEDHIYQYRIPSGLSCTFQTQKQLIERLKTDHRPLLRIGRWPKGKNFAVSITGDIDNVDIWDFWGRIHG
jgi:peptidoglycan/xylan/chitin deacetylase (PgdA/CDA1 family)